MITNIGIVAGDIWHYLDGHGKVKLSDLVTGLDKPRELILMSLGWLAREGHVLLEGEEDYDISLRKKEAAEEQDA
ncbi:MAG: winged helix-turn-helix domain-containing protein [Candidatus Omnitrophica bacterium]|nr:winged helix-turn-helix domain-containing protein [Candidatus Omnitrophota bacterium]